MSHASAGALQLHDLLNRRRRIAALLLGVRLPPVIGFACLTYALVTHVSDRPAVFGRWSYAAFVGMLSAVLLSCAAARNSWRAYRAPDARIDPKLSAAVLVDVAVLLWGVGYLWGTLDVPGNAANLLDLNMFGSTTPATILLYWFSLTALFAATVAWLARRVPTRWANWGLSLATVSLLALVGEGAVRARAVLAPASRGFWVYESLLWSRRYVELNRTGFRDTEHAVMRVPGGKRVLLIGDSFAFGSGIRRTGGRLGEQLVMRLDSATGMSWEVINASHPGLHTLNEIAILDSTIRYGPDVVILEYVFNDIYYLRMPRIPVDAPETLLQRLNPVRLLFFNSFLVQEVCNQAWEDYWSYHRPASGEDPYADTTLVRTHLGDLARFVARAESAGAVVGIVPVDPRVVGSAVARRRYESFVSRALAAGLPIWRVDSAFDGLTMRQLTVNRLDGHPNELANRLVATAIWPRVLNELQRRQRNSTLGAWSVALPNPLPHPSGYER